MKIVVIGAGAMGSIYGARLSQHNEVYMIDINEDLLAHIKANGIVLVEDGTENTYFPNIMDKYNSLGEIDLVILFVKSIYLESALEANKSLIGDSTYFLTLQNGAGHEEIIKKYVAEDKILIGTTEDNGKPIGLGRVQRGGQGVTNIGVLTAGSNNVLNDMKESFDKCGFQTRIHKNIQQLVWNKLFHNASLSVTTGILQCEIGYLRKNEFAWGIVKKLLSEAVEVAIASGIEADFEKSLQEISDVTEHSPNGVTSICADLRNGAKTEIDFISGTIVKAAKKLNIKVPNQEFVVDQVHALEGKRIKLDK